LGYASALREVRGMATDNARKLERLDSTLEDVKRILRDQALQMGKNEARHEREREADLAAFRKMLAEDAAARKKAREEAEADYKNIRKELGRLTNNFGEVIECELGAGLVDKFRRFGFRFWDNPVRRYAIMDKNDRPIAEIDWLLRNKDSLMVVEVKARLSTDDVDTHIERMEKLRRYADTPGSLDNWRGKRLYGAVAGAVVEKEVKKYALGKGLFVIEPSGESVRITKPPSPPHEW
jgi:hypothetical protein